MRKYHIYIYQHGQHQLDTYMSYFKVMLPSQNMYNYLKMKEALRGEGKVVKRGEGKEVKQKAETFQNNEIIDLDMIDSCTVYCPSFLPSPP
jgi:hypothetical protein